MLKSYFYRSDDDPPTFSQDEFLPALPLPKLEDTLDRYYESLKPFGTEEELQQTKITIDKFKDGIGKKLHNILEERARRYKNWVSIIKTSPSNSGVTTTKGAQG